MKRSHSLFATLILLLSVLTASAQEQWVIELNDGTKSVFNIEDIKQMYSSTTDPGGDGNSDLNGHAYVDLGLPSGLLWATCNVGADSPGDYGDYYAWGETTTKSDYSWNTYSYCNGSSESQTKYCSESSYGYNGYTDSRTVLESSDDAATANWGGSWRMPTEGEWQELKNSSNCTWTWTTQDGLNGYKVTSKKNGNSIFLPAAGYCSGVTLSSAGTEGYYWSSSLFRPGPGSVYNCYFDSSIRSSTSLSSRCFGQSVRPVAEASYPGGGDDVEHEVVDLGLPSGLLWATSNVGAVSPEDHGDYFAWGETSGYIDGKTTFKWSTYKYCNGSYDSQTKYCNDSSYGFNGYTDTLTVLEPCDDAATAKWGGKWRMPTLLEWRELCNPENCIWEWTTQEGHSGYLVTSVWNGNSLFLPAGGYRGGTDLSETESCGYYWSASLLDARPDFARYCSFDSDSFSAGNGYYRDYGRSIRAVQGTPLILVTTITLSSAMLSLNAGDTSTLSATVSPSNATNKSVSWYSSDGSIAIVSSDGVITALSAGNATITCMANDGSWVAATCEVTVTGEKGGDFTGHGYINLGLPSGILWATCNIGAESPEEYGDYFAWGETTTKTNYDWSTYKYCKGSDNTLTKYCSETELGHGQYDGYGFNGYTDTHTVLEPSDDAATTNWKGSWRTPTHEEWLELYDSCNCTWTWTTLNGYNGYEVTSLKNGKSIFLPAAGYNVYKSPESTGGYGCYMSSSLNESYPDNAFFCEFNSFEVGPSHPWFRCRGHVVRPVSAP